ncbi:hypothetical protein YC2023_065374 [Brassica napus]
MIRDDCGGSNSVYVIFNEEEMMPKQYGCTTNRSFDNMWTMANQMPLELAKREQLSRWMSRV